MRRAASILIALTVVLGIGPACSADPPTLEERAAAIERASKGSDGDRVVVGHLSRELRLPVETLRTQRTQTGLGWGDLLIANRLSGRKGLTFDQIVVEFRGGKGWGEIARDQKVDPGRLLGDVQRSQEVIEQRAEDKPPRTDMGDRPDRSSPAAGRPGAGMGRGRR